MQETQEDIVLYTTHCPKCRVLETKLKAKNISYIEITDVEKMLELGLKSAPHLKANGKMMDFVEANAYINSL